MKRVSFLLFILALSVVFVSCKKKKKDDGWSDTLKSGLIRIASDENFKTLMDAEIAVFEVHNPEATIIPIYTTENEAIRLLVTDSVRFALTTRDLNSKERKEINDRAMDARKYLIAFDGIALLSNRLNPDSVIEMSTLKKIMTGEITEWSQINPQSPLGTIRVIFDNKESGVLRYAVDSILQGDAPSSNLYALNNYLEVIEKIVEMPNAIGLVGVNVISDDNNSASADYKNKTRLFRISKEDKATLENSYLPYAGDIVQENYPLWRPIYVLLSDPRSGLSSGLSIFLSNEIGQKVILKSGLLPITDPHIMPVIIKDEYPQ